MSNQNDKTIRVLIVEPEKVPYEAEIEDTLKAKQKIVGGLIQAIYPYEEPVALVCNDEGKMSGLPLNRALYDEKGEMYDIIAGTFFVCGIGEDNFTSLAPEHMAKFQEKFHHPEVFARINGKLVAIQVDEASLNQPPKPTQDNRDAR